MEVPFMLVKEEKVLKKESMIDFWTGASVFTEDYLGEIFLTNKRIVILKYSSVFAEIPIESVISIEPCKVGAWLFSRVGFRFSFRGSMGEITLINIYRSQDKNLKCKAGKEWASEWVAEIHKVHQEK